MWPFHKHQLSPVAVIPAPPTLEPVALIAAEPEKETPAMNPVESFFSKVWNWTKGIFSKAPAWTTVAKSTILYVAPLLETIIALVDPTVAPAVESVIDKIKVGLGALSSTLSDANPSAPTLKSILTALTSHLAELEQAAQVKNPESQAKLAAIINTFAAEIQAIASAIPA